MIALSQVQLNAKMTIPSKVPAKLGISPIRSVRNVMDKVHNTETFIKRAIAVHGDKYDYSKSVWKGSKKPITFTCKVHGDVTISYAADHYGHRPAGCVPCRSRNCCEMCNQYVRNKRKASTRKAFLCADCKRADKGIALKAWEDALVRLAFNAARCRDARFAGWERWADSKFSIIRNRRKAVRKKRVFLVHDQWGQWAKKVSVRADGKGTAWQRKIKSWARSLERRELKERS